MGTIDGGCLCGAVRYSLTSEALQTCICHCEDCRKASGAPMMAWTFFRTGAMCWVKGEAKLVKFAERERSFCGDCGTPLMFFDPAIPEFFEVSTCSLDRVDEFPPKDECWISDEVRWAKSLGSLPRYELESPLPGEEEQG